MLTAGPGIPYIPPAEFRSYLKFSDPTAPLLGDAKDWNDLDRSQSIIVGGPDTVYRRILDIIEHAKCGHLLIQFHMGNMPDALVRNSMKLFMDEVAPRLKQASAKLFAGHFPEMERSAEMVQ
jgi:alkanesulfonate monooxygenase SsuD/methylene tetrahydromethanopterin reductase-like flavin-dependent oxidoreductase (luciferase family)